jgi:hypothetical protein
MARESKAAKVNEWSERLDRFQRSDLMVGRFCQSEGVSQGSFLPLEKAARQAVPSDGAAEGGLPEVPGRRILDSVRPA